MSRVGISSNINQPNRDCLDCKYWESATKKGWLGFSTSGHCRTGYCKKRRNKNEHK